MLNNHIKKTLSYYLIFIIYSLSFKNIFSSGAGILPYFIKSNVIYFYILKTESSNSWSDFGGAFNRQESSLYYGNQPNQAFIHTAARYFSEYTNNLFNFADGIPLNYKNIINIINQGLNAGVFCAERRFINYKYKLFFIPVTNNTSILSKFASKNKHTVNNYAQSTSNLSKNNTLAIISLSDLVNNIINISAYVKVTAISYNANLNNQDYMVSLQKTFVDLLQNSYFNADTV